MRTWFAECVGRYAQLFDLKEKCGIRLLVWNVPASSREDVESGEYSTYGSCVQRNETTRLFDRMLEEECRKRQIVFVSIFDKLVDEEGLTKTWYYADPVHLSQRAMPLIFEELRRLKALTPPLLASKHGKSAPGKEGGNSTSRIEQSGGDKTVLVYCGIPDFARLIAARPGYDLCYVIEAEKTYAEYARTLYAGDQNVSIFHASSINLLEFCREHRIERIDKLITNTRADDIAVIQGIDRFIKKKKVLEVECKVPKDRSSFLARLFGDAYLVVPGPQAGVNGLVSVTCTLKRPGETKKLEAPPAGPIFNVVYRDLLPEHEHSVHRGSVSVVWLPLPLSGLRFVPLCQRIQLHRETRGIERAVPR